jgi:phosphoribosyl-AMP cyclohydrolase / phosphoribosyl-ATP pyrophosphohydrolase
MKMIKIKIGELNFEKGLGLIPAIVQDASTGRVLMLGYMNREALEMTIETGKATFFSRSKNRIWTKGETSGNFLHVADIKADCDRDALLIKTTPAGPVCHTGADTCWDEANQPEDFIHRLEQVIQSRKGTDPGGSYTAALFQKGINKIAQKVGEEAVELIIEAKDENRELFLGEAADLVYHFLVLLAAKGCRLEDVIEVLEGRHGVVSSSSSKQ